MSVDGESASPSHGISPPATLLAKKKRIRAGYRSFTTKWSSDCKTLLDEGPFSILKADQLKNLLNERLRILTKVNEEIFELLDEEAIEGDVLESEKNKPTFNQLFVNLKVGRLTKYEQQGQVSKNHQLMFFLLPHQTLPICQNSIFLRIMGIRKNGKSDGILLKLFTAAKQYLGQTKFRQPWTLLEGQVTAAVSGIKTTDTNYEIAIDVLRDRFAQKQVIINSHIDALKNLQNVSSDKDVKFLRKMVDDIDINVRSLKSIGSDFRNYGALSNPLVIGKLPEEIRLAVTKKMKGKEWELREFL
eukprot:gene6521-11985_t